MKLHVNLSHKISNKLKQPYKTLNLELSCSLNNDKPYFIDYYLKYCLIKVNKYNFSCCYSSPGCHEIIQKGGISIIKYMFNKINHPNIFFEYSCHNDNPNIVKFFIKKGLTCHITNNRSGNNCMEYAHNTKIIKILLNNGSNIKIYRGTIMTNLCEDGRLKPVKYLLRKGYEIENIGYCLEKSFLEGHLSVFNYLLKKDLFKLWDIEYLFDYKPTDRNRHVYEHFLKEYHDCFTIKHYDIKMVKFLIKENIYNASEIFKYISNTDKDVIKYLLKVRVKEQTYFAEQIFKQMRKRSKHSQLYLKILSTGFFQSYKDYTEVMSGVDNLRKYIVKEKLSECFKGNSIFFVPGDGRDPQTGYVLANIFKNSLVISIDPRLRCNKKQEKTIMENQILKKDLIQNCNFPINNEIKNAFIVGVHNHGPVQKLHDSLILQGKRVITISIPCCTEDTNLKQNPVKVFHDRTIISEKNEVIIWDTKYYK